MFLFRTRSIMRWGLQIPKARFFVFTLALCMLAWRGYNREAAALQDAPPVRAQDQSAILPLDGAKIFRNYCATCHGASGNGDGPVAPFLKAKVPQLTTLARRNHGQFPADRVRGIIAGDDLRPGHGSREMPVWGPIFHQIEYDRDLGNVRLQNVTEYLRTIQQK